jgi:hypothetical protein
MSWDNDMQDMLRGLQRAHYVEMRPAYGGQGPKKSSAQFRPHILATTALGSQYLDSIVKASGVSHARRKTPGQLKREIAQSLASSSQPQLADLFADPAATKVFVKEARHEIQKQRTSEKQPQPLLRAPSR